MPKHASTRDYTDKMLLAALQEAQSMGRAYDTKAQIVGVGYILALNLRSDAAPILFAWPSRARVFDYAYDKESTNYSRRALEDLILQAARSSDVDDVTNPRAKESAGVPDHP